MYDDDCEVLGFASPLSARINGSAFGDAEYVMTTAPVKVSVRVRNNGTTYIQNRPLRLTVYAKNVRGEYAQVADLVQHFNISTGETIEVDFSEQIANLSAAAGFPKSYSDLGWSPTGADSRFAWMQNNVTPVYRYKADVSYFSDRDDGNDTNLSLKEVRYYLKKSDVSAIVSVQNTTLVPVQYSSDYEAWIVSNQDALSLSGREFLLDSVSSYLNYRALRTGLESLGILPGGVGGYDLFDRNVWEPSSVDYSQYRYMF